MKIHTNDRDAVVEAIYAVAPRDLPGGVVYPVVILAGSRSHKAAVNLSLEGATWDEWGVVLAAVFAADPTALCGTPAYPVYHSADHFHWSTANRFLSGTLPADTHPRHKWEYEGQCVAGTFDTFDCRKCSAHMRRVAFGHTWTELVA